MKKRISGVFVQLANSYLIKLFASYSVIIALMLALLTAVLSGYYSNVLQQDEINYEKQIVHRVSEYFDGNVGIAKSIIQRIYLSDSSTRTAFYNFLSNDGQDITLDYINQKNQIVGMFQSEAAGTSDILDIILYKNVTGEVFHFTGTGRKLDDSFDFSQYGWFRDAGQNNGILRFVPAYLPAYIRNDNRPVYTAYAGFWGAGNKLIGVLMINFDAHAISNAYAEYRDKVKGYMLVMAEDGSVFFDSTNRYYGQIYPYADRLRDSGDYITLDAESIVAISQTGSGYTVAGVVPKDQVLRSINPALRAIFLFMALCIAVSVLMIYLISRHFSQRVQVVTMAMKEVEKGNLKKRIPVGRGNDEVEQINRNFNSMCEKLDSYIQKVYLAEIKVKDAELTALQTQINPHFLYNTLESIRMKAVLSSNEDIAEMIYILANLFKNSIRNKDGVIKIEDEVEYCKAYLELHRIRLGDRLRVSFEIDASILQCGTPKLMLQPLIENSLLYGGLDEQKGTLYIVIKGEAAGGLVRLGVHDDGRGIREEDLKALKECLAEDRGIRNDGSIGLKNIADRLRIIFGGKSGLEIESKENAWTNVTVTMPAMTVEEVRRIAKSVDR